MERSQTKASLPGASLTEAVSEPEGKVGAGFTFLSVYRLCKARTDWQTEAAVWKQVRGLVCCYF